jgi:DNA-binding NarL/FixJ family response regulator
MKNERIKIIVADDHPLILKGIIDTINNTSKYYVIGKSVSGNGALKLLEELNPDIAILDINMDDLNGLEVAKIIKKKMPEIKIVILTMYNDENYFNEAIDLGVEAYILKDCYADEMIKCLDEVIEGEFYLSPGVSKYLINRKKNKSGLNSNYPELINLTLMEKKILQKISESKTSKEIADELFISIRTVQNHRTNICGKLNFKGHNRLLQFAILNKHLINN